MGHDLVTLAIQDPPDKLVAFNQHDLLSLLKGGNMYTLSRPRTQVLTMFTILILLALCWEVRAQSLGLTLRLNQTTFHSHDTLHIGLRASNVGAAFNADFYFGVLLPDGVSVFFFTSLSPLNGVATRVDANPRTFPPLAPNVPISQGLNVTLDDVFVLTFSGSEPPGTYVFFALLTLPSAFADGRVDAGDILVLDTKSLSFSSQPPPPPPPIVAPPSDQMDTIGTNISLMQLEATGGNGQPCTSCTFRVSGLPPDLTLDESMGQITGTIAFSAFTSGPFYPVTVTATDPNTNLTSAGVSFTWRVTQGDVMSDNGDAGDGSSPGGDPGDGGAGGDASDGGDGSPLAGVVCRLYKLDGATAILDNNGNVIQTFTYPTNVPPPKKPGQFILPIPKDLNNAGYLRALEGFIECNDDDKRSVSIYLNTKGLRSGLGRNNRPDGERLLGLKVHPQATVSRLILDNLRIVEGNNWSTGVDPVAVQARFLRQTADQQGTVFSPRTIDGQAGDNGCGPGAVQPVKNVDMSLKCDPASPQGMCLPLPGVPAGNRGRRAWMAGYVASQLYLAALKAENLLPAQTGTCQKNLVSDPSRPFFHQVLNTYLTGRQAKPEHLVELGYQDDKVLFRGQTGECN